MSLMDEIRDFLSEGVDELYFDAALIRDGKPVALGGGNFAPSLDHHECRARIEDYSDTARAAAGIPISDRLIRILPGSIFAGIVPQPGDAIYVADPLFQNRDWLLVRVKRSAAGTYFEAQAE